MVNLKQMGDTMTATLTDITGAEAGSGKTYDQLMKAKTAEVEALTESVEEKTKCIGDLGVKIVGMKEDLSDSEESLMEHKKFLAELEADTEDELVKQQDEHKPAVKELMATEEYISQLYAECDWLIQYFDVRKEARTGEIDALGKAQAVLSGADFGFLQVKSVKSVMRSVMGSVMGSVMASVMQPVISPILPSALKNFDFGALKVHPWRVILKCTR